MVLSLSCGDAPLGMARHLVENANMWRVSADFWDNWQDLRRNFDLLADWAQYNSPGAFPDGDMLPVGLLSLDGRPHGPERYSKLTWPEHYSLFTLWIIAKSPLMLGADLRKLPPEVYAMISNPEVINVNQNSSENREVYRDDNSIVWYATDSSSGDRYLGIFNISDSAGEIGFKLNSAGLVGKYSVGDLWKNSDLGITADSINVFIDAHGAVLLRLKEI
jgi:hypothetical protein